MTKFEEAYNRLNKQQKLAVDTVEGPVMVIAGPGTGKTQILTLRIANILNKTQTEPSSILALTFTDSGVKAMKERLVEFIGPTGYQVDIFTFHSFCQRIIEDNPEDFSFYANMQSLSDFERVDIYIEVFNQVQPKNLRGRSDLYYFLTAAASKISELKREGITPEKFKTIVEDYHEEVLAEGETRRTKKPDPKKLREIDKLNDLAEIYDAYQKLIWEKERYDFEDMITFVIRGFEDNDELLARYQEQYQYILSDEYQDTNTAQNEVIRLLTSFEFIDKPNVFVVGDDEQSIYRFQGASIENFRFFEDNYPETEKITLVTNYRSTQNILDSSRSVIGHNLSKIEEVDRNLQSFADYENKRIKLGKFSHEVIEKFYLGDKIKQLIEDGVNPNEIAVLYRTNREGEELSRALAKMEIKVQISKGENLLEDHEIKKLLNILKLILDSEREFSRNIDSEFEGANEAKDKDMNLFNVMHYPFWGIDTTDILKLLKFASDEKKHLDEVLSDGIYALQIPVLEEAEKIREFWEKIIKWRGDSKNEPFVKLMEIVLKESGLLEQYLNSGNKVDILNKLNRLFKELAEYNQSNKGLTLGDFFDKLEEHGEKLQIKANDIQRDENAVQLMTAHGSKGLEFEHVFITNCTDGDWGNARSRDLIKFPPGVIKFSDITKLEKNEDARRLFYVAMTRAKKELHISYSHEYFVQNGSKTKLPSVFINEIDNELIEYLNVDKYDAQMESALELFTVTPPHAPAIEVSEEEFLKDVVINRFTMSATALNTYLECPYRFKLDKIFRIPRSKSPALAFGSAVHKALEDYVRSYINTGKYADDGLALESFRKELGNQLLTKSQHEELLERGKNVISEFLEELRNQEYKPIAAEYNFSGRNVYLDNIKLSGKVDRIDVINETRKEVRVVDYKTGNPKTAGQVLGTTKDSNGNSKRQLVFYKLLSQLDQSFTKFVESTKLEYVEKKTGKDKFDSVEYVVTDEDLKILRETIRDVTKKIKNLEFPRTEDKKFCNFCEYKEHCWRE